MENSLALFSFIDYKNDFTIKYNENKFYNIKMKTQSNWLNFTIINLKLIPNKYYNKIISFHDLNNFFTINYINDSMENKLNILVNMIINKKLIFIEKDEKIILCYDYNINSNIFEFNIVERNKDDIINELIQKINQLEFYNSKLKKEKNKLKKKNIKIIKKNKNKITNFKERRRKKKKKISLNSNSSFHEINKEKNVEIKENINNLNFQLNKTEINNLDKNIKKDLNSNNSKNPIKSDEIKAKNLYEITSISHYSIINFIIQLKDSRICVGLMDSIINIYDNITFSLSLTINTVHNIFYITQIHDESLVISTYKNIKLFSIKNNIPQIIQNLAYHKAQIYKTIELSNKINLVSCSQDMTIIIYKRNNENRYEFSYNYFYNNVRFENILEIKENIVVATSGYFENNGIFFFDIKNRHKITDFQLNCCEWNQNMCLINDNKYLIVGGRNKINLIDCMIYKIIYELDIKYWNWSINKINENEFITGGDNGYLTLWKLDNNKIIKIYEKPSVHNDCINAIIKLKNENIILTCSDDKKLKILKINE